MRENRPYGSEGGEAKPFPTPITDRVSVIGKRLNAPVQRRPHGQEDRPRRTFPVARLRGLLADHGGRHHPRHVPAGGGAAPPIPRQSPWGEGTPPPRPPRSPRFRARGGERARHPPP